MYSLEPFGDFRRDLRSGISIAANVNMWRGKGERPVDPTDYVPEFRGFFRDDQVDDNREQLDSERAMLKAMGAQRVPK